MKTSRSNLLAACMAAAVAGLTLPASAIYYVSHWDFSADALGEFDYTGHNDLVNDGNVPIVDGAATFDGTAKSLVTGHNVVFRSNRPYTIECFALAEPDCDGMIMEVSPNNNATKGGFYLYAREGVMARNEAGGHNGEEFINGTICDGVWHHLAVIIDPTTNVVTDSVRLYVDSVRQGVRRYNDAGVILTPHRFYIGSRGGTGLPFKGKIDDVRITEGILSTNEFLKTRSAGAVDVRAYWKFDSANPLADSSGNGNTLQGSQGVTFANGCASFNGTASDVRTVNKLDLSAYKDVTVEFFIRKPLAANDVGMIIEHAQNSVNTPGGFYLTLNESRQGGIWGLFRFPNNHYRGLSPTYAVNTGWHHVALVKDSSKVGNDGCISLYVDGVRMNEYAGYSKESDKPLLNDYLYFGSRANNAYFLNADIDDVRITANVLPPGHFLRTRTGPLDDAIAYWPFDKTANMLEDASGNGNVLTGTGVAVNDGAAVFDGSQSGFATLAPLPLYAYRSMTVEWFMRSSMSDLGVALELTANMGQNPGAFNAIANEYAGYKTAGGYNVLELWSAMDGRWHHYALVYDRNETTYDIVRLYRDGSKVTTHKFWDTDAAKLRAGTLFVGTRGGSQYPFVGELDDIKITGRALDPSEFMTKRSSPPGVAIFIR